jgi:hypothetical protein
VISWVKEGPELVGEDAGMTRSFHRIRFNVQRDRVQGVIGAAITAWGDEYLQPEEFDPEDLKPVFLSSRIVGFNCRVATNSMDSEQLSWMDAWDQEIGGTDNQSNHIPRYIELTLYLEPLQEGEEPVAMKRCVDVPLCGKAGMK